MQIYLDHLGVQVKNDMNWKKLTKAYADLRKPMKFHVGRLRKLTEAASTQKLLQWRQSQKHLINVLLPTLFSLCLEQFKTSRQTKADCLSQKTEMVLMD